MSFTYQNGRRYDLDWLRIIAFGILIFYHIGMFYVTWGWHIKSPHAGPWLEPLMRLVNPWRLTLLFFISGLAARFMLDKVAGEAFAKERLWRLFIPLFIGMQFIVAPQSYFQFLQADVIEPGFWAFFAKYSDPDFVFPGTTTPTWNHLWYIAYLLVYSFLLVGLAPWLKALSMGPIGQFMGRLPAWAIALAIPVLPLLLVRFTLTPHWPTTHNLIADWANHATSFYVFLLGYVIAKSPGFWRAIDKMRHWSLGLSLALIVPLSFLWVSWDGFVDWVGQDPQRSPLLFAARSARILYAWFAITTLLGFAQRTLNKPSRALSYLTSVIFPYYILHQTLIIVIAYPLSKVALGLPLEAAGVVFGTVGGCVLISELIIKRVALLRVFFGMKAKTKLTSKLEPKPQ